MNTILKHLIQAFLLIACSCIANNNLSAQDIPVELQQLLEQYLEELDADEFDITDIIIRLEDFKKRPLELNTATYEELTELLFLTGPQIQALIDHRIKFGDLLSIEELQSIPDFDIETIKALAPYVTVKKSNRFNYSILKMMAEGRNEVFLKWRRIIEEQKGFIKDEEGTSPYLGDPNRLFVRYRHNYENRLKYGFTLEKDPGEEFFKGSNKQGFDYMTAHLYLKDYTKFLKDLALGDYTVSMGQGLIMHNNFGSGKSSWVNSVKKGGRAFRAYNSVNENDYFRGAGATMRPLKNIELSLFGSYKKLDATVVEQDDEEDPEAPDDGGQADFSSIRTGGLHRTLSEIANEKTITALQYGGIVKYQRDRFHFAVNYLQNDFGGNFVPNTALYRTFQQIPSELNNLSVDYSVRIKNWHFFGESALSNYDTWANIHGLLLGLDKTISASIVYRNYSRGYVAINPNAFGESSRINNEEGIYMGVEIRPVYAWKLSLYADFWKNPWASFTSNRPSYGKEYLAKLDYIIKRKLNIYAQIMYVDFEQNDFSDTTIKTIGNARRLRLRTHVSYKVNKTLELRSRVEFHWAKLDDSYTSNGNIAYADLIYKPAQSPFSMSARYMIFDTDDYNSRIYTYENDILYEFYIPAFANKGSRYYVNFRYKATRWLTAEFRVARTQYEDRFEFINNERVQAISSGNNLIIGDSQTEIKAQLVFKF